MTKVLNPWEKWLARDYERIGKIVVVVGAIAFFGLWVLVFMIMAAMARKSVGYQHVFLKILGIDLIVLMISGFFAELVDRAVQWEDFLPEVQAEKARDAARKARKQFEDAVENARNMAIEHPECANWLLQEIRKAEETDDATSLIQAINTLNPSKEDAHGLKHEKDPAIDWWNWR